ncbi:MAG: formylglycine-generating enzyme family protein, partial [Saprospiraceae bacterium]
MRNKGKIYLPNLRTSFESFVAERIKRLQADEKGEGDKKVSEEGDTIVTETDSTKIPVVIEKDTTNLEKEPKDVKKPKKTPPSKLVENSPISFTHFYTDKVLYLDTKKSFTMNFVMLNEGQFNIGITSEGMQELYAKAGMEAFELDIEDEVVKESVERKKEINYSYCIGRTEVTLQQYNFVMNLKAPAKKDAHLPVTGLKDEDIKKFIAKLNKMFPSITFDLPHEKEWEYAAKGISNSWYPLTDNFDEINSKVNVANGESGAPQPVDRKDLLESWSKATDMIGNVKEVCYIEKETFMGEGLRAGDYVARGGSYLESEFSSRTTSRHL